MGIGIQIDERFQDYLEQDWLRQVAEETLATQPIDSELELGLLITDDATVCELNREYRGIDEPTDVLTFALGPQLGDDQFIMPPDGILHLGEVIISYNQAVRQAEENGYSLTWEIAWLVVHGILHLLGYDHDEPAREEEMRGVEERILNGISGLLS